MNEMIITVHLINNETKVFDSGILNYQIREKHLIVMQKITTIDAEDIPWVISEQYVYPLDNILKYTVKTKTKKYDQE